ncbi:PaaI family thioesterase [Mucilaginibacter ginkgonis]|uniref:DUF4442 domain-containing protein n=1 Tax=Mucilaginibacter ginkgonis TaxID=2682091 RepID=A0A6I4I1Q3_9SPHI|nr:DUF4442 domain-containing protein [Mucilaginibacter ginkgonis]QQL51418.1 DUF4442 domain-containing protein [Mucilaginibacter ginkgonis]
MSVSAFWVKWLLRIYPPLFFQRIWVQSLSADFKQARVKINKSLITSNYNNSIFGGTIFSATDPFYPVMVHQVFIKKGYNVLVWSKSSQILFVKPGNTDLFFEAILDDAHISEIEHIINTEGKHTYFFDIEIKNKAGEVCAAVTNEVYIRNLNFLAPEDGK